MSYQARNLGTAATLLPKMKRAVGFNPDTTTGFSIACVPDANRPSSGGDDVTGNAKIYLYRSSDTQFFPDRTTWSIASTITPGVSAVGSTQAFVGSMATAIDSTEPGTAYIAWQGSDNSLRITKVLYNAGTDSYTTVTEQTIVTGTAVTNRFRAIDISVNRDSANATPVVAVYEAAASTGQGAYIRVYVRNADGTTWRKAHEVQIMTTQFIREGSEDVSVAWGASGTNSNVGHIALYYTNTNTASDSGDTLKELSYNVSTGTDNSATTVRTWASNLNQNVAAGSRRGWLYQDFFTSTEDDVWVFGGVVGMATPFYIGARLRHTTSTYFLNTTTNTPSDVTNRKYGTPAITGTVSYAHRTSTYQDSRLVFGFVGVGVGSAQAGFRSVVFRWSEDDQNNDQCLSIDSMSRVLDGAAAETPLAIYGGSDPRDFGRYEYTFMVITGAPGATISTTDLRDVKMAIEDTFPAPDMILPVGTVVAKNKPDLQVRINPSSTYSNVRGKLEFQIASDSAFTLDVQTFMEDDEFFRTFESVANAQSLPQYITFSNSPALSTGTWYWRARVVDDLGGASPWGGSMAQPLGGDAFSILHTPAPQPLLPSHESAIEYKGGTVWFSWNFTDPEPTDTQSAYRIIVTRTDTGAVVTDTTKVASSAKTVVLTISNTLSGIPLTYTIQVWDADDTPSLVSNPVRFTLYAAPLVLITAPTNASQINTSAPTVSWTFTASGRTQTHYRVLITNVDASPYMDVADSGWVVGASTSHIFASKVLSTSINYRALVYVRDSSGMIAHAEYNLVPNPSFEMNVDTWTATNCSVAKSSLKYKAGSNSGRIVPAGGANPQLESPTLPLTANHSYTGYFWAYSEAGWSDAQVGINWRDNVDASISTVTTNVSIPANVWTLVQHTATAPSNATGARLRVNMTNTPATANVLFVDDVHLKHAPILFTASWIAPALGDLVATHDEFKVTLSWTNANVDSDFVGWRVYRKYNKYASAELDIDNTRNTWEMIYETGDSQSSYTYRDYFAPLNKAIQYIVVQVVDRSGSLAESTISSPANVTVTGDRFYFVPAVPIGTIASFEASNVTGDSFSREIERETLNVSGRGRQVQVGDDLGYMGTLTLKLRNPSTARSDREFIELLCSKGSGRVYVRSPFGDVIHANFGNPQFTRLAGVGGGDLGDLSVPYVQIYDEVPIRRAE